MPRVSVGVPVRDAERFLEQALRSVLRQDVDGLEVVISDNASTDATADICRDVAATDPRVRYVRQERDNGLAWNFNHVVHLATAPYFKWAAYDDLLADGFLPRCTAVLDDDPTVAVCSAGVVRIDGSGAPLPPWEVHPDGTAADPVERFRDYCLLPHACTQLFGVMRRDVLLSTRLHLPVTSGDRVLLAELALRGRIVDVPEPLFLHRWHSDVSVRRYPRPKDRQAYITGRAPRATVLPEWAVLVALAGAVGRAPLTPGQRLRCRRLVAQRAWQRRSFLVGNLKRAGRELAGLPGRGR